MKKKWSRTWKKSVQTRKQRKFKHNAPNHVRQKAMGVHLSKELAKKHGTKTMAVRKGDTVKIVRGQFSKKTGNVMQVKAKVGKVYIEGIENVKKDGSKAFYPLKPSNIMITELNLDDRKRKKIIDRRKKNG